MVSASQYYTPAYPCVMANRRIAEPSSTHSGGSRGGSSATTRSETSRSSKAPSPPESSRSAIDFQFLNFSHPSDAKASKARRAVRSHVTRQQHQREHAARRAKSYQASTSQTGEPSTQLQHAATFPSARPSTLQLPPAQPPSQSSTVTNSPEEESSPDVSPSASPTHSQDRRVDPYELYPEAWHPYVPRVMEYYLNTVAVDIPDVGAVETQGLIRTRFFPFIMTDPAPLHAVMLIAATHYSRVRGARSHPIDLLQLRGMTIREINAALEDPVRATSDPLIAAVAAMASYEVVYGDRRVFNTHMTGLTRMVTLRGGLPALGLDGLLERILLWIDANAAHITSSHVFFDRRAFPSNARHPRPDPRRFVDGLTL